MRRLVAIVGMVVTGIAVAPGALMAEAPPDTGDTLPADSVPAETVPLIDEADSGAETPAPVLAASEPLVQIPSGCPSPDPASVVFVGTLVAKDRNTARFAVEQVRAGTADGFIVTGLVDIRYDNETQYLVVDETYLVGAAPSGTNAALVSKVDATDLLFGGNAVIGLTEKSTECPVVDDPIRTLRPDGTEVETSLFTGLSGAKRDIALAFVRPLAVAFAVILALVLVRWLFTAIFVSVRKAADGEPVTGVGRGRRHLPDL